MGLALQAYLILQSPRRTSMVSTTGAICHMLEHRNTSAFISSNNETSGEVVLLVSYIRAPHKNYTLQYVEIIQRHHKRTPYASNTFFKEDIAWSCVGEGPVYAMTRWENFIFWVMRESPFLKIGVGSKVPSLAQTFPLYKYDLFTCCRKFSPIWQDSLDFHSGRHSKTLRIPGHQRLGLRLPVARMSNYFFPVSSFFILYLSLYNDRRCQFPQITAQGLDDSITHGAVRDYLSYYIPDIQLATQDLRAVYASRLDLGDQMDPNSAIIRALGLIS